MKENMALQWFDFPSKFHKNRQSRPGLRTPKLKQLHTAL